MQTAQKFLEDLLKKKIGFPVWSIVLTLVLATGVWAHVLFQSFPTYNSEYLQTTVKEVVKVLIEDFPNDLEVVIAKGELTTNQELPYSIQVSDISFEELAEIDPFLRVFEFFTRDYRDEYNNLATFLDFYGEANEETFEEHDSLFIISRDKVSFYDYENYQTRSFSLVTEKDTEDQVVAAGQDEEAVSEELRISKKDLVEKSSFFTSSIEEEFNLDDFPFDSGVIYTILGVFYTPIFIITILTLALFFTIFGWLFLYVIKKPVDLGNVFYFAIHFFGFMELIELTRTGIRNYFVNDFGIAMISLFQNTWKTILVELIIITTLLYIASLKVKSIKAKKQKIVKKDYQPPHKSKKKR